MNSDQMFMQQALQLAQTAAKNNEVPVGAVLVLENKMIGQGWNQPIHSCDPTAHAEIIALRQAAKHLNNYRLIDTTLYVTLEPCIMCIGAIVHARVKRVVYAAADPKVGAVQSALTQPFNHQVEYVSGVLAEPCSELLRQFFKARR